MTAKLMEDGFDLAIMQKNGTYGRRVILDKGKILANNRCGIIIPKSYELYIEIGKDTVEICVTNSSNDKIWYDTVSVDNAADIMRYALVYMHLGCNIGIVCKNNNKVGCLFGGENVANEKLKSTHKDWINKPSSEEPLNNTFDRWNKLLMEGIITFGTSKVNEMCTDLDRDEVEEILRVEGVTQWD